MAKYNAQIMSISMPKEFPIIRTRGGKKETPEEKTEKTSLWHKEFENFRPSFNTAKIDEDVGNMHGDWCKAAVNFL